MKTPEQIDEVFAAVIAKLPKYVAPPRVMLDATARLRGALRISVGVPNARGLVSEFVHGCAGWIPYESGVCYSREIGAVQRAMRAAMKVHP